MGCIHNPGFFGVTCEPCRLLRESAESAADSAHQSTLTNSLLASSAKEQALHNAKLLAQAREANLETKRANEQSIEIAGLAAEEQEKHNRILRDLNAEKVRLVRESQEASEEAYAEEQQSRLWERRIATAKVAYEMADKNWNALKTIQNAVELASKRAEYMRSTDLDVDWGENSIPWTFFLRLKLGDPKVGDFEESWNWANEYAHAGALSEVVGADPELALDLTNRADEIHSEISEELTREYDLLVMNDMESALHEKNEIRREQSLEALERWKTGRAFDAEQADIQARRELEEEALAAQLKNEEEARVLLATEEARKSAELRREAEESRLATELLEKKEREKEKDLRRWRRSIVYCLIFDLIAFYGLSGRQLYAHFVHHTGNLVLINIWAAIVLIPLGIWTFICIDDRPED